MMLIVVSMFWLLLEVMLIVVNQWSSWANCDVLEKVVITIISCYKMIRYFDATNIICNNSSQWMCSQNNRVVITITSCYKMIWYFDVINIIRNNSSQRMRSQYNFTNHYWTEKNRICNCNLCTSSQEERKTIGEKVMLKTHNYILYFDYCIYLLQFSKGLNSWNIRFYSNRLSLWCIS